MKIVNKMEEQNNYFSIQNSQGRARVLPENVECANFQEEEHISLVVQASSLKDRYSRLGALPCLV